MTEYYKDSPTLQGAEPVVVAGEAVEGIDEALAVGGDVNGTVTGAGGAALAGVKVNIYEFLPRAGWVLHRETKTGADGTYSAKKIPAGAYRVGFVDEDHGHLPAFHGGASMKEAEDVLLTKGGEVEVDAKLTMGSVVNGRVSDQLGEFAGDVTVTLYRQGPAGTWGETPAPPRRAPAAPTASTPWLPAPTGSASTTSGAASCPSSTPTPRPWRRRRTSPSARREPSRWTPTWTGSRASPAPSPTAPASRSPASP